MSSFCDRVVPFQHGGCGIPCIGFGTWTVFEEQGSDADMHNAVKTAIAAGYRHIDCAWAYRNQPAVGQAICEIIQEGKVTRDELFITSKLWDTQHNPKTLERALKENLRQLQTPFLDLFLMHFPTGLQGEGIDYEPTFPKDKDGNLLVPPYSFEETWKAMEDCQKAGLTKNIGLSNFNSQQITRILDVCDIKPVVLQAEMHPWFQNRKLREFCQEKGIVFTAYGPFTGHSRLPAVGTDGDILQEPTLVEIAEKKGKTVAQVILRWHNQNGCPVIVKSITPARIQQNINIFDFELTQDEMTKIDGLDKKLRFFIEEPVMTHPEYPWNLEY